MSTTADLVAALKKELKTHEITVSALGQGQLGKVFGALVVALYAQGKIARI